MRMLHIIPIAGLIAISAISCSKSPSQAATPDVQERLQQARASDLTNASDLTKTANSASQEELKLLMKKLMQARQRERANSGLDSSSQDGVQQRWLQEKAYELTNASKNTILFEWQAYTNAHRSVSDVPKGFSPTNSDVDN